MNEFAVMIKPSVSFLSFPSRNHLHDSGSLNSFVCRKCYLCNVLTSNSGFLSSVLLALKSFSVPNSPSSRSLLLNRFLRIQNCQICTVFYQYKPSASLFPWQMQSYYDIPWMLGFVHFIIFLVVLSISLISSVHHSKNGAEYRINDTVQVFMADIIQLTGKLSLKVLYCILFEFFSASSQN